MNNELSLNCSRLFKCDAKTLWKGIENGAFFNFCGSSETSLNLDFKQGGTYSMEWGDKSHGRVDGTFLVIEPLKKVTFSWQKTYPGTQLLETQVTMELLEEEGATLLTLLHEGFENYTAVEDHSSGWQAALRGFLDSLSDIIATHALCENTLDLSARYKKTVGAPVETVFNAVADGSKLAQYFAVNREDNFEAGKDVIWHFNNHQPLTLHVHQRIENQLIKFKWGTMHVCFTFREKEDNQTEVYLEFTSSQNDQKGFGNFTDECEGWADFMFRMKLFVEKGFVNADYK